MMNNEELGKLVDEVQKRQSEFDHVEVKLVLKRFMKGPVRAEIA